MRSENPLTLTCPTGPMTIGVPIYTELPSREKIKNPANFAIGRISFCALQDGLEPTTP